MERDLCSFTYDYTTNDVFIIIINDSRKTATAGQRPPPSLRLWQCRWSKTSCYYNIPNAHEMMVSIASIPKPFIKINVFN